MGFIQIIEYETDKPDEMMALGEEGMEDGPSFTRLVVTADKDHPGRYFTIVEFPSYEAAMEVSGRPETDAFAKKMGALCTSGPTYRNLDIVLTKP